MRKHKKMLRMKLVFVEGHAWLDCKLKVIGCYHSLELASGGKVGASSPLQSHQKVRLLKLKAKAFQWNAMCRSPCSWGQQSFIVCERKEKNWVQRRVMCIITNCFSESKMFSRAYIKDSPSLDKMTLSERLSTALKWLKSLADIGLSIQRWAARGTCL